jgi:hypothetical protein
MAFDDDDVKKVFIALLGAIGGAAILQSHHNEKRKSRAEKDDPEGTKWICEMIWDLLDDWQPPNFECEDNYTDDLFRLRIPRHENYHSELKKIIVPR